MEFWLSQGKFLSTQAGAGPFAPSKVEMWRFHSFVFSPKESSRRCRNVHTASSSHKLKKVQLFYMGTATGELLSSFCVGECR